MLMTEDLIVESGVFRSKNAGVYNQNHDLIHAGSPANADGNGRTGRLWHTLILQQTAD